jgi:hypothetical protein
VTGGGTPSAWGVESTPTVTWLLLARRTSVTSIENGVKPPSCSPTALPLRNTLAV